FVFDHNKVRSAIYDLIDPEIKRSLHILSAGVLSKDMDNLSPEKMLRISEHHMLGGDHQIALDMIIRISRTHLDKLPSELLLIHLSKAIECLDNLEVSTENYKRMIEILQSKGRLEEKVGSLNDAMESYLEAVQISETTKIMEGLAESYRRIGDLKLKMFRWDQTIDFYLRSLHISKKQEDPAEIAKAFKGLGMIYFHKGDYSRSMECYLKYMEFPENKMISAQTDAMIDIGDIYYQMGDLNQSLAYYKLAIKKGDDKGSKTFVSLGYIKMSMALLKLGEVEDTLRFAEHAYLNINKISDQANYQQTLLYYIELMIEFGEIDKAEEAMNLLDEIAGEMTNPLLESQKHRVTGIFLSRKRDFKGSIKHMRAAIDILETINIPFQTALTYFDFGLIRFQQMDVDGALEMLAKANSIFKEIKALHYLNRT
ncbi:MAG: hypothetical protein U9R75_01040, partial [Candidatus Thermoplasmatota archaeon]|nr:hypothetical protein [Candidatus Thermoplasmatota archaeon]